MNQQEASAATTAALNDLLAVYAKTDDPDERQTALLVYYGANARTQAAVFLHDIIARKDLKPGEDLGARGQVIVDAILKIALRANAERGLDFAEFAVATKQIVTLAFFDRLNQLLAVAIAPPQGNA